MKWVLKRIEVIDLPDTLEYDAAVQVLVRNGILHGAADNFSLEKLVSETTTTAAEEAEKEPITETATSPKN